MHMKIRKKKLMTCCAVPIILLFVGVLPAAANLSMDYRITDGLFSPANGSASENLTGSFTIKPGGLIALLPDGSIVYPNPPSYVYDSLNLQTANRNITMASGAITGAYTEVPALGMVRGVILPHFLCSDRSTLSLSPVTLDLTILEHGLDGGREYWRYLERALIPVDQNNRLSYDGSGNYYPSGIHFTYDLRESVGEVIQALYPPGMSGPEYTGATESSMSIGTLSFDVTPVPVPGAFWLLGGGLIALAGFNRKHGRRRE